MSDVLSSHAITWGFHAGEEVVTKESFISICWRLIPYWLNNWEQQWGAECSSMMFELPHFAVELIVILPCVQVRTPVASSHACYVYECHFSEAWAAADSLLQNEDPCDAGCGHS